MLLHVIAIPFILLLKLIMHHGAVQVPYPLRDALQEAIRWSEGRSSTEDLVIVYINKCRSESGDPGHKCENAVTALLNELRIPQLDRCEDLERMTLEEAMRRSRMSNGGHMLVVRVG